MSAPKKKRQVLKKEGKPKLRHQIDAAIVTGFTAMKDSMEKAMQGHKDSSVINEKWVLDFLTSYETKMQEDCEARIKSLVESLI